MTQRNVMEAAAEAAFEKELVALIPHMRAFARSLAGDAATADDLAQDALAKAWRNRASFEPGTNLKAWVFVIVRNTFYTDRRRAWRSTSLDPEVAERTLLANDAPDSTLELQDLRRALALIHPLQREAIILVGAGGLAYEEAAVVLRLSGRHRQEPGQPCAHCTRHPPGRQGPRRPRCAEERRRGQLDGGAGAAPDSTCDGLNGLR